jgi:hypothetical protein
MPSTLQSHHCNWVSASQKAAQARLELIARNIAESGFKPLYKRLLQLTLVAHGPTHRDETAG